MAKILPTEAETFSRDLIFSKGPSFLKKNICHLKYENEAASSKFTAL